MRQRFVENPSQLTDAHRLELLLTFAIPRRDVAPLSVDLIARFGSLDGVLAANRDALTSVSGLGENSASLIQLVAALRGRTPLPANGAPTSSPRSAKDLSLFDVTPPQKAPARVKAADDRPSNGKPRPTPPQEKQPAPRRKVGMPTRQRTGLFSAGVFGDAARLVAKIPLDADADGARQFLQHNGLHYSSATTRNRYASYIVTRLFPAKHVDTAILRFARAFDSTQSLRDVVLYRLMKAEPVLAAVVNDLLLPSVGRQSVPRTNLRRYLTQKFPESKPLSVNTCAKAVVEALSESKLAATTKTNITAHFRPVDLRSFAFILHSEFPEPGMHKLETLEQLPALKAMLWQLEQLQSALYELRNQGLITKVSEIDSFRQFTTRFTLDQAVDSLIAKGGTP